MQDFRFVIQENVCYASNLAWVRGTNARVSKTTGQQNLSYAEDNKKGLWTVAGRRGGRRTGDGPGHPIQGGIQRVKFTKVEML